MKRKRIAAMAGLILIGLFYAATLILAFLDNPFAKNCLMAALFLVSGAGARFCSSCQLRGSGGDQHGEGKR